MPSNSLAPCSLHLNKFMSALLPCRFKEGLALSDEEVAAFEQYFYHITASPGSGEHALRYLLKPFAWAANPLEQQLRDLKVRAS